MEVFPCYRDPDGAWRIWKDLELEVQAAHIIKQAKMYAATKVDTEAKWISSNGNWLKNGGWKTHYDEVKSNSKACVDCGEPYAEGHKYIRVDGKLDQTKFRCIKCREASKK
jgi:hypothetical protein